MCILVMSARSQLALPVNWGVGPEYRGRIALHVVGLSSDRPCITRWLFRRVYWPGNAGRSFSGYRSITSRFFGVGGIHYLKKEAAAEVVVVALRLFRGLPKHFRG